MFEHITVKTILARMLDWIRNEDTAVDTSARSPVYMDAAPVAIELMNAYIALDAVMSETYADSASRESLIKRAAERGLKPEQATFAVCLGEFNIDIPLGATFSLDSQLKVSYEAVGKINAGEYRMKALTAGVIGNQTGRLLPLGFTQINGLTKAELTEILIPGADEEDTERFRRRYFDSFQNKAFGGNKKDYRDMTNALPGVGDNKVIPVWNGGGTVKLIIIDSAYGTPSQILIDELQNVIDPQKDGHGDGLAPIDHIVTVVGVESERIDISTTITYQAGWDWNALKPYAEQIMDDYLLKLREDWGDSYLLPLVVRSSEINSRLLDLSGVLDIFGTEINGSGINYVVEYDKVPVRGVISG